MAKKKASPAPKKKVWSWPLLVSLGVVILAVGVFVYLNTPSEEMLDLSVIEQGQNVVVQIHDPM